LTISTYLIFEFIVVSTVCFFVCFSCY